jgi:hypothetical protein
MTSDPLGGIFRHSSGREGECKFGAAISGLFRRRVGESSTAILNYRIWTLMLGIVLRVC